MSAIELSWEHISDLDLKEYIIQYTQVNGTCSLPAYTDQTSCINNSGTWTSAWETPGSEVNNTEIYRGFSNKFLYSPTSLGVGNHYFLIKALDTTGHYSDMPGYITYNVAAPSWATQYITYKIKDGLLTLNWPEPSNKQFGIEGYQVRYRTGNSSQTWAGAIATGQGTTEGAYSAGNSITFPINWGPGQSGTSESIRTFIIKAKDTMGNESSNEVYIEITIAKPDTISINSQFVDTKTRVWWTENDVIEYTGTPTTRQGSGKVALSHYKVYYDDYKTDTPIFSTASSSVHLDNLGTTEFEQVVTWGPNISNNNGNITSSSGTSNPIRRYWVIPVDTAGNWGLNGSNIPEYENVEVARPNNITGLTASNFSTDSSNGVVEITWTSPVKTSLPIDSIKIFWEQPIWSGGTLTSTRGLKNSKAWNATKYSTPVDWGPTQNTYPGETTRVFYFVCYDTAGNISLANSSLSISVNNPQQLSNVINSVIDNNVILRWEDPGICSNTSYTTKSTCLAAGETWTNTSDLPIISYDIFRCPSTGTCTESDYLSTANFITNTGSANTYTFFETAAGTYKYFVRTKDTAGNYATPKSISALVNEPRDFEILDDVDSNFNSSALVSGYCSGYVATNEVTCEANGGSWVAASQGSWTNIYSTGDTTAVLPVNTTETWQSHFTSRGWTTLQNHIDNSHDYYLIPPSTATYWQKWDLGDEVSSTTVTFTDTYNDFSGTVTATPTIYYMSHDSSNDTLYDNESITSTTGWTAGTSGNSSLLANNIRYLKLKIEYSSSSYSFREIVNQNTSLNLRTIRDQSLNQVYIGWNDRSTGATVSFNKTFQDINSISVTPTASTNSNGNYNTAIYDFTDIANPTSFTVYLLDATDGTKTDGYFTWQATGV